MRTLKYNYWKIIQQNYGLWEDVSHYESDSRGNVKEMSGQFKTLKSGSKLEISLLSADLKEYQTLGYPTRVIFRKELIC